MTVPAASSAGRLVWTVEEAGVLLGISRAHAYELVARGDLPHIRLGRRIVVPKIALDALMSSPEGRDTSSARGGR